MMKSQPATTRGRLAIAALSGAALLAAGCATASSGHPAAAPASAPSSVRATGAVPPSLPPVAAPSSTPAACAGGTPASVYAAPGTAMSVPALAAVQFVSPRQGWVVGAGRVLATGDGGQTWVQQYSGPASLDQVDFIDARHGWAVGTDALLGTTDGGATWSPRSDPCAAIRSVHFVTPDLGFAVAGGSQVRIDVGLPAPAIGGELLSTSDGGQHWLPVPGAPAQAQTVCFTSPSSGFLGTPGQVWRTADGGRHWSLAIAEPAASGTAHPGMPDTTVLECAGNSAAWVLFVGLGAALGHAPYLAYATQDARTAHAVFEESYIESAVRPQVHAPEGPGSYPGPFSVISPDAAAFVGEDPAVGYGAAPLEVVTDSGAAASRQGDVGGITVSYGAAFISPTQGWVVGKNAQTGEYAIEATTDGGHTWTREYQTR